MRDANFEIQFIEHTFRFFEFRINVQSGENFIGIEPVLLTSAVGLKQRTGQYIHDSI